jgi:hypothetical protein
MVHFCISAKQLYNELLNMLLNCGRVRVMGKSKGSYFQFIEVNSSVLFAFASRVVNRVNISDNYF